MDVTLADQQTFLISTKYMQKLELEKWKKIRRLDMFRKVRFANKVSFVESYYDIQAETCHFLTWPVFHCGLTLNVTPAIVEKFLIDVFGEKNIYKKRKQAFTVFEQFDHSQTVRRHCS